MKRLYGLKILLMLQIVSLLTMYNIVEVKAGGDYPEDNKSYTDVGREEDSLTENDSVNDKVIAYIYGEAAAELGNSLLDVAFASAYFGLDIAVVEDLTSPLYFNPTKEIGMLLALTLADKSSVADAIQVLKNNPIVEYTQVDGIIKYIGDFKPGKINIMLNSDIVVKLGDSLLNAEFVSSLFGIHVVEVKGTLATNALYLILAEESKQSVIDAIAVLHDNPNVKYANPIYISYYGVEYFHNKQN